jgi:hypothetical protein
MYSVLERHKQAAIIETKVIDKCIQFWKDKEAAIIETKVIDKCIQFWKDIKKLQ